MVGQRSQKVFAGVLSIIIVGCDFGEAAGTCRNAI